jgi:polyhydroxyalkanoate synthesis repressor PhaR
METSERVIKRYSNRKLYDMTDSRYITLDRIAEFVRAGQEIKVIDNQTQEDLTAVILSQILFEQEKRKRGGFLPISTLQSILQSGEKVFERTIAKPVIHARKDAERKVNEWVGEAEKTVSRLVKKGSELDGQASALKGAIGELLQKRLEEFTVLVDTRVKSATEAMNRLAASSIGEVDVLKKRIEDLEKTVRHLSGGKRGKGPKA